jgi:CRISPR-associated endonuclease Csy4
MSRFFTKITFLPEQRNDAYLAGRCIQCLHGFVKRFDINTIGVSFPEWSVQSVGREIAFVSTSADFLSILNKQDYFKEMQQRGFFELTPVKCVEEQGSCDVCFVRNQRIAKASPASLRREVARAKRRAAERGEKYKPQHVSRPEIGEGPFHKVPVHSHSTGKAFCLFIQKVDANENLVNTNFNSYGLSRAVKEMAAVPMAF